MAIKIPNTVFEGLMKWMMQGPWPEHFQEAIDDHLHAYCDAHDLDTFDELADKIGPHWVSTLNDGAMNDFLSRETEDGNVVDLYLKRRGWNEKVVCKAYLQGIRDSVMSIYEVSEVEAGKTFLARDLILGGDPIRVEEKSGTQSMLPWEQFAMRIVGVRGHHIIAGGLLPYKPELSEQVIAEIDMRAEEAEVGIEEMFSEQDEYPAPELIQGLSIAMALRMSAPLFSEAWLAGTVLDPDDMELPAMFNSEGDEIEFVQLHCTFATGTTQKQLRGLLDAAEDMEPASAKIWNWVAPENEPIKPRPKVAGNISYQTRLENGAVVRGMIELHGKKLEANVSSAERAENLKDRLQVILGELVSAPIMVRQTLEQAMAAHRENLTPQDQLDLPPDVENQLMKDFYDRHYRETLDQPIPMLDNKTPREAATTPTGRQKVIAWLKHLETGEAKSRQGKTVDAYDFSWVWEELGLRDHRK